MKRMIVLACLGFAFTVSTAAFAAGEKIKGCSKEATGMKGAERKAFMKKCLSKDYVLKPDTAAATSATPATATPAASAKPAAPAMSATPATPAASSTQQDKMKACNAEAKTKGVKGDERKKFMSACLKG